MLVYQRVFQVVFLDRSHIFRFGPLSHGWEAPSDVTGSVCLDNTKRASEPPWARAGLRIMHGLRSFPSWTSRHENGMDSHIDIYMYIYVYIYIYIWWRWDGLRLIKIIHTNQNIMVIHMNGMAYVSHMFFSHIHSWDGLAATKCFIQSQDVGSWNQPKAHLVMSKGKWCLKPRLDKKPRKDGGSTKECRGSWCC